MLRRCLAVFAVVAGLAGCASPVPQTAEPTAAPIPDPIAGIATTAAARSAARSFVSVVETVEPVAESECRARSQGLNCDFRIVVDDTPGQQPNAFQTLDADGRPIIAFTLSLLTEVRNEDELAFIMAHEAAHHVAGHLARQQQNAVRGAVIFGRLATVSGRATPAGVETARQLGAVVGSRRYSQDFELEADALGTVIAARAGFDPVRGAEFFFRLPDPGDRFLGTHPPNAARVAIVQQTAAELGL
nr:M48 family metallopeptidase [Flavimaricola marinus]